jgi:hypothetical protein
MGSLNSGWNNRLAKRKVLEMRYVLLVCNDESEQLAPEERNARYAAYTACQEEMESRGVLVARERLRPTSASTTVRFRQNELVIADGPFAETKEQIAGYFVVEVNDLDEAVELASLIPAAHHGTIEVRPIWEM